MLRRAVWYKLTDTSNVLTAFIVTAISKTCVKKWVKIQTLVDKSEAWPEQWVGEEEESEDTVGSKYEKGS
jgi:hypothetical protein